MDDNAVFRPVALLVVVNDLGAQGKLTSCRADASTACDHRERDLQPAVAFRRGPDNDYWRSYGEITVELSAKLIGPGLDSPEFELTMLACLDRYQLYPTLEQRQFRVRNRLAQLVGHDTANVPNRLKRNLNASVRRGGAACHQYHKTNNSRCECCRPYLHV